MTVDPSMPHQYNEYNDNLLCMRSVILAKAKKLPTISEIINEKKNWLDDVYAIFPIFPIFLFVTFLNKIIFKIPIDFKEIF